MKSMMAELANAGLTQEDILHKTQVLMKAFKREDPTATLAEYALASKQKNLALKQNNTSPKDFTLVCIYFYYFNSIIILLHIFFQILWKSRYM